MKKYLLCTLMTALAVHQAVNAQQEQINISVTNKTGQILVIAAQYEVLPSTLIGMPNPFISVDVPANTTKVADFNRVGGGRLGELKEIVIRTRNEDGPYIFKTLSAKELDTFKITIDKSMLPAKK